jgi:hypothetical protein
VDDDGLALWAGGIKQAGITDFFQPTARVGLEENGKESSGTPGGGRTVQTPMGMGLGLPLTSQASGPPRPDRKITAFYSHIEKRQGVGGKAAGRGREGRDRLNLGGRWRWRTQGLMLTTRILGRDMGTYVFIFGQFCRCEIRRR